MDSKRKLIPKYAIVPAALYIAIIPSYFLVRLITGGLAHHNVSIFLDDLIPFVPAFIWIYVLAYAQWFVGYLSLAYHDEALYKRYMGAEFIGKLTCIVIFILLPTAITRPEVTESGVTFDLIRLIYASDTPPDNLFPSLHCMESWLVARGLMKTKAPRPTKAAMWVFSILVFLSVVFVKQHLVLDIPGGIIMAEIALYLSEKLKFHKLYDGTESKLGLR